MVYIFYPNPNLSSLLTPSRLSLGTVHGRGLRVVGAAHWRGLRIAGATNGRERRRRHTCAREGASGGARRQARPLCVSVLVACSSYARSEIDVSICVCMFLMPNPDLKLMFLVFVCACYLCIYRSVEDKLYFCFSDYVVSSGYPSGMPVPIGHGVLLERLGGVGRAWACGSWVGHGIALPVPDLTHCHPYLSCLVVIVCEYVPVLQIKRH